MGSAKPSPKLKLITMEEEEKEKYDENVRIRVLCLPHSIAKCFILYPPVWTDLG